jgi:hypothetical protein
MFGFSRIEYILPQILFYLKLEIVAFNSRINFLHSNLLFNSFYMNVTKINHFTSTQILSDSILQNKFTQN